MDQSNYIYIYERFVSTFAHTFNIINRMIAIHINDTRLCIIIMVKKIPFLDCTNMECKECIFDWKNAKNEKDCFLLEIMFFSQEIKNG